MLVAPSWKGNTVSDLSEVPDKEKLSLMESDSLVWRLLQIGISREAGELAVAVHNEQEVLIATYWCGVPFSP